MSKINISMVILSLDTGGAESMAYQLAKDLDKNKFNLNFICLGSNNGSTFEKELASSGINISYLKKGPGLKISTFFKIWKELSTSDTHIVHTHLGACLYAFPWSVFHNRKLLHTIHNTPLKELPSIHRSILKVLYKTKKAIPVAISDTIKKQTISFYNLNKENIPVIYNPVNIDNFAAQIDKKDKKFITFICVARLTYQKNHKMLLKAFSLVNKQVPNTILLLAGDGDLKEELKLETKRLKINENVRFLGNIDNIAEALNKSDVFVLSSLYEGLPMTILEAMGTKLPIIATRVGGVPDVVKENGILVESEDVNALVTAMLQLAGDDALRSRMGLEGFNMSKSYNISIISRKYEDLYEKYTGAKKEKN